MSLIFFFHALCSNLNYAGTMNFNINRKHSGKLMIDSEMFKTMPLLMPSAREEETSKHVTGRSFHFSFQSHVALFFFFAVIMSNF